MAKQNEKKDEKTTTNGKGAVKSSKYASHTITHVRAENPKAINSATRARFEFYKKGDTVAQALEKGVASQDIAWDLQRGYIELQEPKTAATS